MQGTAPVTLIIIGETGKGKTSLCRLLTGSSQFQPSDGSQSATLSVSTATVLSNFCHTVGPVLIVDTPGLNDSKGRDNQHLREMSQKLRQLKTCNLFVLVTDTGSSLSLSERDTIGYFRQMFGAQMASHIAVAFSRVSEYTFHNMLEAEKCNAKAREIAELFGSSRWDTPQWFFESSFRKAPSPSECNFRDYQLEGLIGCATHHSFMSLEDPQEVRSREEASRQLLRRMALDREEAERRQREQQELERRRREQLEQERKRKIENDLRIKQEQERAERQRREAEMERDRLQEQRRRQQEEDRRNTYNNTRERDQMLMMIDVMQNLIVQEQQRQQQQYFYGGPRWSYF